MTTTVDDDNKVQGIILLTEEASKFLNPSAAELGSINQIALNGLSMAAIYNQFVPNGSYDGN
jgi:hypothetical protein